MPLNDPEAYTGSAHDPMRAPHRGSPRTYFQEEGAFNFDSYSGTTVPDFQVGAHNAMYDHNTVYIDLETTGLRTQSFNVLDKGPRGTTPGIMEIATFYREGGTPTASPVSELTGYSEVIPREHMKTLTEDQLKDLTVKEQFGPGSRVDEAVTKEGKLRDIFMDFKHAAETGKYHQTDVDANFRQVGEYLDDFTTMLERSTADFETTGKSTILTGWNISFDANMMIDTAMAHDELDRVNTGVSGNRFERITSLIDKGAVEIRDLDEPLRKYIFHQAMQGTGMPEHLDRKAMNEALQQAGDNLEAVREEIVEDVRQHGSDIGSGRSYSSRFVGKNDPLVSLGQDVRDYRAGDTEVFRRRLTEGMVTGRGVQTAGGLTDRELTAIDEVAEQLATIANATPGTEQYEAYKTAQAQLRQNIRGGTTAHGNLLRDIVDGGYKSGHQSLLGTIYHTDSHLPWKTLDSLTSGLDYVGGRTQDIIAQLMGHPMAASAHVAMADIPMGSELSNRLDKVVNAAIDGDPAASAQMDEMIMESKRMRFLESAQEVVKKDATIANQAAGAATSNASMQVTDGILSKAKHLMGEIGGWKGVAVGAAGGFLLSEMFTSDPQIEATRRAHSQYDLGHGIMPSDMGDPTITAFGSGRDANFQIKQAKLEQAKGYNRKIRQEGLRAGRDNIARSASPINHTTVRNADRAGLRHSLEKVVAEKSYERVILPEVPKDRARLTGGYDMAGQAEFSKKVQKHSGAAVDKHPDLDNDAQGVKQSRAPEVAKKAASRGLKDLSAPLDAATMNTTSAAMKPASPHIGVHSKHTGNSKIRNQGAKNFTMPPTQSAPTVNQARALRGQE